MESKVKYALAAQAAVILSMSSVAAYAAITYPEKVATLIRNAVSEEEPAPEGYGGPFASNLEYDGVVPSMYLEGREILVNTFDKHVSTAADFDRWMGLVQRDVRVTVYDISPEPPHGGRQGGV